ncbi:MAG: AtpZ/AtpI family protein [Pseudomonadota bacterium]
MPGERDHTSPNRGGLSDDDREEFRKRASDLGEKLERHREQHGRPKRPKAANSAFGQAMKMALEPLAGVLFGLVVGLGLDNWLGTKPVFLIVFLVLGAIAGMVNMVRSASTTRVSGSSDDKDSGSDAGS